MYHTNYNFGQLSISCLQLAWDMCDSIIWPVRKRVQVFYEAVVLTEPCGAEIYKTMLRGDPWREGS